MRAVIQRVKEAHVEVQGISVGKIEQGYLIYLGIHVDDTEDHARKLAHKVHQLRINEDENGKMNKTLSAVGGSILVISQFTLYGDTKGNNRPSFIEAARPEKAYELYELFSDELRKNHPVARGQFGEHMQVYSINDGPVTIIIEM